MSVWQRLLGLLNGSAVLPVGFTGRLSAGEHVLATATCPGGLVLATSHGLWLPVEETTARLDWHMISKAVWRAGTLTIIAAEQLDTAGDAVLLQDQPPQVFSLTDPGELPRIVHERVTSSIRSSSYHRLPGGGAWVVQRRIPGRDGVLLQVRPDPGTDLDVAKKVAAEISRRLHDAIERKLAQ